MNQVITLAQPTYYYQGNPPEITPNLRRTPLTLDEIEISADEIETICELKENWYPFIRLIKVIEEEPDRRYKVKGYYLTGEFDLTRLKMAIDKRLMGKRLHHPAFSDNSVCDNMERVAISWNDTHILAEYGRGTKLSPRKKVR